MILKRASAIAKPRNYIQNCFEMFKIVNSQENKMILNAINKPIYVPSYFKKPWFTLSLLLLFNVFFYIFLVKFNYLVPFEIYNYNYNSHHYIHDNRVLGGDFELSDALAQFDSQWYLKIASDGYSYNPHTESLKDKTMGNLSFAFFPLYPAILALFNLFSTDLELSAFIVANIFIFINLLSLYWVTSKVFSKELALKTAALMFLFPFSIFFRSYFAEGIFLFLLIWFCYFLYKKSWLATSIFLALIMVTKGGGLLLLPYTIWLLWQEIRTNKLSWTRGLLHALIPLSSIAAWIIFVWLKTGDPLFFYKIQKAWYSVNLAIPFENMAKMLFFWLPELQFHNFHSSKVDAVIATSFVTLLIFSRRFLPKTWWWVSLILVVTPLLSKDLMSYSRLIIVVFPLFIYLAHILKGIWFYLTLVFFTFTLVLTGLYFVNWYWVG